MSLPKGLHVQSDQPRDPLLIPTVLTIDAPAGVRVASVIYPHPSDFKLEGQDEPLAVFDHEFVVGAELEIAGTAPIGDLVIPARLRYQACDDKVCFQPTTAATEWTLQVVNTGTAAMPAAPSIFEELAKGRRTDPPSAADPQPMVPPVAPPPAGSSTGLDKLDGFVVLASTGGYVGSDDFMQFIRDAEQGTAPKGWFEGRGPLAILLLILVGGLALNLTPCVLPMIPINLAIIGAGAQAGSRRRGFLLGSTYGAAMAVVYGVLGLIVILTAGTFGTINASPWFNAGIAALFVVLGLAMFDVFNIDFSRYSSNLQNPTKRGTFAVAFTMGAVAALLAGACVAPVVIQVVLFSSSLYASGTTLALALPFFLGLGMALPWPIAGAGLSALPKPGVWMVRVKQAFGVVILGTAIYYGYVCVHAVRQPVGGRLGSRGQRAGEARGGMDEFARRRPRPCDAGAEAGAHRLLGDVVQELSDDGQDHAGGCGGHGGARRLREDQVPGRRPRRRTGEIRAGAIQRHRPSHLRDSAPERRGRCREPRCGGDDWRQPVRRVVAVVLALALAAAALVTAQAPAIIKEVRTAIAANDFAGAGRTLAAYRAANGVTPEMLEALSWMGRGALAAKDLNSAEKYARETYELATAQLKARPLDQEPRLPIALGAAIEVISHVDAARGARTEAVAFLENELDTYKGTSIVKRIQKNINLLSLEGRPVPAIDTTEYLGPKPPSMAELKGKVVLMFFWAHWCADCKTQGPVLAELAKKYGGQGLVIFAPTQRFGYVAGGKPASAADELRYIDEVRQTSYPVLAGQAVPVTEANHVRFGVSTTPTLVLVDRAGIIRLYHPGRMPLEQLEPRVRALLDAS